MASEKWRGLKALVQEAVEHGSRRLERAQKEMARRPFELLEQIPPIAVPVKGIHEIHDTVVTHTHETIRLVTRVAGDTLDTVLNLIEKERAQDRHS